MSIKLKRSFTSQLTGVLHSEAIYNSMALKAAENNLVKLTDKQLASLKALNNCGGFKVSQGTTFTALTTRDRSTAKHILITPQLAGSPVTESNRASQDVMRTLHIRDIMQYLASKDNEEVNALFLTFSFKNAEFGHLSDAEQALNDFYKRLKEFMRKTVDWGSAKFLGTLPSMEVTVNREHLLKMEKHNLYHPHYHVILFYSGKASLGDLNRQLWRKFHDLCERAKVKASSAAFFLEKTYSDDGSEDYVLDDKGKSKKRKRRRMTDAILEATKYAVKPAELNSLAIDKKEPSELQKFKLAVWAELYNASVNPTISKSCPYRNVAGKKATRIRANGSGLYQKANQIFNAITEAGLGGVFDFQLAGGDLSRIPAIFTQAVTVEIKKIVREKASEALKHKGSGYRYYSKEIAASDFNLAEILYYNDSILRNTMLPSKAELDRAIAESKYNLSAKSRAVVDVLKNFVRWNCSVDDIDEVFADWIETILHSVDANGDYNSDKLQDVQSLQKAYHYAVDDSNYKQLKHVYRSVNGRSVFDHSEFYVRQDSTIVCDNQELPTVRNFKALDLANKIAYTAKNDDVLRSFYENDSLLMLYRQALAQNGTLQGNSVFVNTVKKYVNKFVALRTGLTMTTTDEFKYAYAVNEWNFWNGEGATSTPLTGLPSELSLLLLFLMYAFDPDRWRDALLTHGSAARTVNVVVTSDMLTHMVNRLLKNNQAANNPLFREAA